MEEEGDTPKMIDESLTKMDKERVVVKDGKTVRTGPLLTHLENRSLKPQRTNLFINLAIGASAHQK